MSVVLSKPWIGKIPLFGYLAVRTPGLGRLIRNPSTPAEMQKPSAESKPRVKKEAKKISIYQIGPVTKPNKITQSQADNFTSQYWFTSRNMNGQRIIVSMVGERTIPAPQVDVEGKEILEERPVTDAEGKALLGGDGKQLTKFQPVMVNKKVLFPKPLQILPSREVLEVVKSVPPHEEGQLPGSVNRTPEEQAAVDVKKSIVIHPHNLYVLIRQVRAAKVFKIKPETNGKIQWAFFMGLIVVSVIGFVVALAIGIDTIQKG